MILTCSTCGHRGEDGKDYNHDCYWVFRERGDNARMSKKRGYSKDFTPHGKSGKRYLLDQIPAGLWADVKAKCKREGVSIRALILQLLRDWVSR